jgi:isopenicillin-N epimerase
VRTHAPAHIPLDLRALDVDYYSATCHKWLCAPKGAGFLYVRRELQRDVHPLQISWGYEGDDPSFVSRHEKQGTRDSSAYLTVPAAIAWQSEHEWDSVRERCDELARRARNELGLEALTPDSEEFFRQMVTLRVPEDAPKDLQERLYNEHRIEVPVFERGEERFIRVSFQGYNDAGDLERLRDALAALL